MTLVIPGVARWPPPALHPCYIVYPDTSSVELVVAITFQDEAHSHSHACEVKGCLGRYELPEGRY